jgi:hypothetical protein
MGERSGHRISEEKLLRMLSLERLRRWNGLRETDAAVPNGEL